MQSTTESPPAESLEASDTSLVRRVCIPAAVQAELDASDLREPERKVIYWLLWRCQSQKSKCCTLHQRTLDFAISERARMRIIKFLKLSSSIRPANAGKYRPGRQSRQYELKACCAQHNDASPVVPSSGVIVGAWVDIELAGLLERCRAAWRLFGWDRARMDAEWRLSQIDGPDADAVIDEIRETVPDPVLADAHIQAFKRFAERRTDGIFRKDGRVYHSVTSLPRSIRQRVLRFAGQAAESVDVSACYPWCLAAEHRQMLLRRGQDATSVDSLMDTIEDGKFYERLAQMAGVEAADAKHDFQVFCVFGPIGFHPLWFALQTLCPGLCRTIEWWRLQRGGATRLAHFLQRAEGALMTDGVVAWLASRRVPVVQVHDAVFVPAGFGNVAADYLRMRSRELYGRSCRVKLQAG